MIRGRGFTLVELSIALAVGAGLLAATLAALVGATLRHEEARALSRLHERAGFVFGVLEPELQMAGFGGLRPLTEVPWPAGGLPSGARACGTLESRPAAVGVLPGPRALACPAADGGAVESSPVLLVTRASGRESTAESGRLQVVTQRAPDGRQAIVADAPSLSPANERSLRDLLQSVYYLARSADAGPGFGPALRVKELTSIAGRAAYRDTEVMDGIESWRVEEAWRPSTAADASLVFAPPGVRSADRPLEGLRVWLLLRSDKPVGAPRTVRLPFAGALVERHDAFLRHVARRDFSLRNLAGRGLE